MEQENNVSQFAPLTAVIHHSYEAVAQSDLEDLEKRNLLFALYSFRCLFDYEELHGAHPILLRYGCTFLTTEAYADAEGVVSFVDENGNKRYKFDAGSPLFRQKARSKELGEWGSLPQKPTLFEMVYTLLTLPTASDRLKGEWYVFFPYVFLIAPTEHDLYDRISELLRTDDVFESVLHSDLGDTVAVDEQEIDPENPMLLSWYAPYIEWRREKPRKKARYNERLQELVAKGEFERASLLADAYLSAYPDDEELMYQDITARMALCASAEGDKRNELLAENTARIADALTSTETRQADFLYLSGVNKLGRMDIEGAARDFASCLAADPDYEKANQMLLGIKSRGKDIVDD